MKKLILFGIVFLNFITMIYAPFTFIHDPDGSTITEDVPFSFDSNVSVSDSLVNYSVNYPDDYTFFTINSTNGVISFTLSNADIIEVNADGDYPTYSFTLIARNLSNASDNAVELIDFTLVNVNDPPSISPTFPVNATVEVQENSTQDFNATFFDIDLTDDNMRYEWYIDGVLNSTSSEIVSTQGTLQQTNVLTYRPNLTDEGIHTIVLSVNDTFNAETNFTWTVNVTKFDVPPVIDFVDPSFNVTINETDSRLFFANFSDFDGDPINASWFIDGSLVFNETAVPNSTYNFTTNLSSAGNYTLLLNITSDTKWDSHVWGVEVVNLNQAPNITLVTFRNTTLQESSDYEPILNFTTFDFDDNLQNYSVYTNRSGGTLIQSGTFASNNISTNVNYSTLLNEDGNYTFSINVEDTEGLRDTFEINVTIENNTAPYFLSFINVTNTTENQTVLFGFNFSDLNPNSRPAYDFIIYKDGVNILNGTQNGSIPINGSFFGNITFNFSDSGIRNITYQVDDRPVFFSRLTLFVNVSNVNLPPNVTSVISNSPINEGDTLSLNFTGFDFDENLAEYTVLENGSLVSNGTFSNNDSELIEFNRVFNFTEAGNYTYNIFVNDTDGLNDTFEINITVIDNLAPIIDFFTNISSINEDVNQTFSFNYSDSNNNVDSILIFLNGSIQNTTNFTQIYFNQTSAGTYNLTYFINDTEGLSDTETIIFQVNETNFAPQILNISFPTIINEGEVVQLSFNASDIDNNIDTFQIFRNGTLLNNSNISYWQTNFTNAGNWNITFFVNDTGGLNDTSSILLTVNDNIVPNITSFINVTTGIEGSNSFVGFTSFDNNSNINVEYIYLDGVLEALTNETLIAWDNDDAGLHNVTYFVNDTEGLSYNITIVINVSNTNQAPVVSNITSTNSYTIQEGENTTLFINATDADLNIDQYRLFRNGTLVSNSTTYLFDLTGNFSSAGVWNFSAVVNDTFGETGNYSILLTVIDNIAPTITNYTNSTTINEGDTILVSFNATDSNSNLANYSIYRNGTLETQTNTTSLYFNFTSNGLWNITYEATDDEGLFDRFSINITVNDVNDVPILNFTNASINVSEDRMTNVSLAAYVFDEDDAYSQMNWSCFDNVSDVNVTTIFNNVTNFLEVTTANSFVGNVNVSCTVYDRALANDSDSFIMFVTNLDNDAPIITNFSVTNSTFNRTTNLTININETDFLVFNHSSFDIELNSLNYSWRLDGNEFNTTQNTSFYFNYTTAGIRNISIFVLDNFSDFDYVNWTINVTDVNRAPEYGTINDIFESRLNFTEVSNLTVNISANNISLNISGGNYSTYGYALSEVFTDGLLDFKIGLNYTQNVPNGTSIRYFIRTGPTLTVGSSWSAWQEITSSNFTSTVSTGDTFFQYVINMTTTNTSITPYLTNLTSRYTIADRSSNKNTQVSNWIDIDNFFYDIDTDNILNYSILGASNIVFTINSVTNQLTFNPATDFIGTETVSIIAFDGTTNVTSDNITFTILDVVSESPSSSSGGGGGGGSSTRTITEEVEVEVEVPVEVIKTIELVLPEPIKEYNQTSVVVPILVQNTLDTPIEGVSVYINQSNSTLNLSNQSFYVGDLEPGERRIYNITVSNPNEIDSYYLNVTAESEQYGYSDTGKVFIEAIAKEQDPDYQATSTKIDYAQEFLLQNKDCVELIEQVTVAQEYMLAGEFDEANLHVEKIIDGCTRIVEGEAEVDFEDIIGKYETKKSTFQNYWEIILIILLVLLLIPVFTSMKKFVHDKTSAKNKSKDEFDEYLKKLE